MAGRKPFEPTDIQRSMVFNLAAVGIPQKQIADRAGIDHKTLLKYFRAELDRGLAEGNVLIADGLFKKARQGDIAALIFLAKVRLGWTDRQQIDVKHQHQHQGNVDINHREFTQAQIKAEIDALEQRRDRAMARRRMVQELPNRPDKLVH
jgi:hypothetical protein